MKLKLKNKTINRGPKIQKLHQMPHPIEMDHPNKLITNKRKTSYDSNKIYINKKNNDEMNKIFDKVMTNLSNNTFEKNMKKDIKPIYKEKMEQVVVKKKAPAKKVAKKKPVKKAPVKKKVVKQVVVKPLDEKVKKVKKVRAKRVRTPAQIQADKERMARVRAAKKKK